MRLEAHVGKEFSWAFILMTFLLLTFTFVLPSPMAPFPRALNQAYSPTTIAAGSMPVKPGEPVSDWIEALKWMKYELPPSPPDGPTVVASWWDYGYWITIIANKTTLADNGTTNATQIAQIGRMFMSNETEAIEILKKYDATYVVVFTTFDNNGKDVGWGDEGKWRWMARIAGLNESAFGETKTDESTGRIYWEWNAKGQETIIYKLMTYGKERTLGSSPTVTLNKFVPADSYFSQTPGSPKAYGGAIPLVCVYKIKYS